MKKFRLDGRKLATAGIALATLLGASVVAAPAAQAAGCYYSSCRGAEPTSRGCNDGVTIYAFGNGSEVRWSNACQAMWVRANSALINQWGGAVNARMTDYYVNSSGYWPQYSDHYTYTIGGNADFRWTAMTPMGTNELATVSAFDRSSPYINTIRVY